MPVFFLLILAITFFIYFSFLWFALIITLSGVIFFIFKKEYMFALILVLSFCVLFFHYKNNKNLKIKADEGFINTDLIITGFTEKMNDFKFYVEAYPFKIILDDEIYLYRTQRINLAGFVRKNNIIIAKEIEVRNNGFILFKFFSILRKYFIHRVEEIRDERFKSLIYAFIMGNKYRLDFETKENFRLTGLFHLLAISGLHIGIIVMFVNLIAGLFLKRGLKYFMLLVSILLYTSISGFSPPVMRAGLMFLIYFYFEMKGKKVELFDILLFTSFISIMIFPEVVFKLSFWLSYLSVAGIYFFSKPVEMYMFRLPEIIKKSFSITLAASISIFPLLLYVFKSFSLISFISNMLIIPLFSIFLIMLVLNFLIFLLNPAFSYSLFKVFTESIFNLIGRIVEVLSYLPLNIEVASFGLHQLIICYILIGLIFLIPEVSFYLRMKRLSDNFL